MLETTKIHSIAETENSRQVSHIHANVGSAQAHKQRGSLLLIVLVTIIILSLSAYTFTALMQTEEEAARLVTKQLQSKCLADSGMDFVRLYLSNSRLTIREKGGLWDNPQYFQAIPVADGATDPNNVGYFSVATSSLDEEGQADGQRFGLIDESSKINLNTLPHGEALLQLQGLEVRDILMTLPEMNEEIADAILNWLDADDDPRDFDSESGYYQSLDPAYDPKNGPMDSLDEMLLIRGVTPELLFGMDTNRNGLLDPEEMVGTDVSSTEADMYLGWANYLTLYSNESNLTAEGLPRINVNGDDLEQLYDDLKSAFDDDWANFIIYYRCSPEVPLSEPPPETAVIQSGALLPIDFDNPEMVSKRKFDSIVDVVGSFVDTSAFDDSNLTSFAPSPVQFENRFMTMPTLMATLTTYEGATIPGRINIMQAPRLVLEGIPGVTPEMAQLIVERRGDDFELDDPDGADMNRKFETWLWVEDLVTLDEMQGLMSFICTGGDVYQAEIVGYFADGIGTSRAEVVFDTTVPIPRILSWRNKSHLRASFSIDALGTNIIE
ncbi:MAG: hypothetical protein ACI87E_001106 [Mariniblastus sp.]|jgi:hypothetical protein